MIWGLLSTVNFLVGFPAYYIAYEKWLPGDGAFSFDFNEQTAVTFAWLNAVAVWFPVHLFWLVNMFTGGSAGLFFLFGMIATYLGAALSGVAVIFGLLEVLDDTGPGFDTPAIPFAVYAAVTAGTDFMAFTNLATFEEWKNIETAECIEREEEWACEVDEYGEEVCPEEGAEDEWEQDEDCENWDFDNEVCLDEEEEVEEETLPYCDELEEEVECEVDEYGEEVCPEADEEGMEDMLRKLLKFF